MIDNDSQHGRAEHRFVEQRGHHYLEEMLPFGAMRPDMPAVIDIRLPMGDLMDQSEEESRWAKIDIDRYLWNPSCRMSFEMTELGVPRSADVQFDSPHREKLTAMSQRTLWYMCGKRTLPIGDRLRALTSMPVPHGPGWFVTILDNCSSSSIYGRSDPWSRPRMRQ